MNAIPLNIAFYRRRAGLTQTALAGQIRIRPETLSRIENGKQELTEYMEHLIASALELTADERNHMIGLPLGAGTSAAKRAPRPGSESRLWLVGAPSGVERESCASS